MFPAAKCSLVSLLFQDFRRFSALILESDAGMTGSYQAELGILQNDFLVD